MSEHLGEHTPSDSSSTATPATFADLGLSEETLTAIHALGFEHPSPIQEQAIPLLLSGRDVIGVAQTGTGKTAAFGLPLLERVDTSSAVVQALVLAPTRELALQGADAIESFARGTDTKVLAVYGGSPYPPQLRALENGVHVVVGTPGRIMDLIDRGALVLDHVSYFVLDEADEMLRMGFAEDVEKIASDLPAERVSALFSATMPPAIRRVADSHLHDPEEITVTPPASTVANITQEFAVVPARRKVGALARVLAVSEADAALVFVRTRATAEDLAIELGTRGVATAALSGDVAQKDRERLVSRLRDGTLDVLIATDVAARGLDVERIGLVVNFDVPREADTYVHRIGRTGRAGREGRSLTFVTPKELPRLRRIAKTTKSKMEEIDLPTPAEVSKLRAAKLMEQARTRFDAGRLGVYREVLEQFLAAQQEAQQLKNDDAAASSAPLPAGEDVTEAASDASLPTDEDVTEAASDAPEPMSLEDIIVALLALGVRDPGPSADEEESFTGEDSRDSFKKKRREAREFKGGKRYRIEVGHKDRVRPGAIVGALTHEGGLRGSDLGHIDIYPTFSLVEIGVPLSPEARRRISEAQVSGRALRISEDSGAPTARRGGHGRSDRTARGDRRGRGRGSFNRGDEGEYGSDYRAERRSDRRHDRHDRGERRGGRGWRRS
ncbi:DEAD/DEAH box helicase [Actinotignum sanguinis]|uniref:RNA helicase n=2 Tax=Actinomycetaceae TaxID=2049 RepID=A0ABZ0RC62_9ACTO|nr:MULTISPECIES: DEAD/DEAH box helicase [Actinotignum]WPJ89706.1 DEAD/DEAH box helicase [Schaalia turicensis]MDE1552131.1 DEAD/DEAH box helicase [Actinotignum sanguinis]MDE1565256.1 DEAD/DEAH box helicase [Actinotignum sanguinis]MDE1577413.1 DEAD/DEAH box helicase [Actinotignum sanguinis]MDE1642269.1 DEAD/DEAH box helicase [Actinotignum sanguinis]